MGRYGSIGGYKRLPCVCWQGRFAIGRYLGGQLFLALLQS